MAGFTAISGVAGIGSNSSTHLPYIHCVLVLSSFLIIVIGGLFLFTPMSSPLFFQLVAPRSRCYLISQFLDYLSSQTADQLSLSESQVHDLRAMCQNKAGRLWYALSNSRAPPVLQPLWADVGSSSSFATGTLGSTTARAPSMVPTYIANWSMRRRELSYVTFLSRNTRMNFIRKHPGRVC